MNKKDGSGLAVIKDIPLKRRSLVQTQVIMWVPNEVPLTSNRLDRVDPALSQLIFISLFLWREDGKERDNKLLKRMHDILLMTIFIYHLYTSSLNLGKFLQIVKVLC